MDWIKNEDFKRHGQNCGADVSYYQRYTIPVAAALWCGIPANQINMVIDQSSEIGRAIFKSPYIPCLEPKCRALHEAIEAGDLSVYREQGGAVKEHVAPERRHVSRKELKEWISKNYPNDKPTTIFDEIERGSHSAISAEAFTALQADRDAAKAELVRAEKRAKEAIEKMEANEGELKSLRAIAEKLGVPGEREETTYLNIIGGLLGLMLGKSPAGNKYSVFDSQSAIISALLGTYIGKPGIASRTLDDKFAKANKSIKLG